MENDSNDTKHSEEDFNPEVSIVLCCGVIMNISHNERHDSTAYVLDASLNSVSCT